MSIVKEKDSKKWINTFVALVAIIVTFASIRFMETMGEWFDLEAKVGNFLAVTQGIGILLGVMTFAAIFRSKSSSSHLQEVYGELVKVIWPDKDSVVKITIGLIISLSIVSGIFVAVDYFFQWLLRLIY